MLSITCVINIQGWFVALEYLYYLMVTSYLFCNSILGEICHGGSRWPDFIASNTLNQSPKATRHDAQTLSQL